MKDFFTGIFVVILREFFDDPQTFIAVGLIALAVILVLSVGMFFAITNFTWWGTVLLIAGLSLVAGVIVAEA